ncbi:uncharacterized protein LOC118762645 [Octopus sinensis]|uniref:Uncharacterized protein LOC118762645 n=1 Tax=Octopus sinensis TaxID=2607531 RepID=A0A7E6EQ32_9MOLL|nr:uncharacterized protein LOC118762645 [Octopus sinensis]
MSHKRSACVTQRNKKIWTKNLMEFQDSHRKRRPVPLEEHSLENNCRIPIKLQIVGRYLFLGGTIKGRKGKTKEISKEVTFLWQKKLNFSYLSIQNVQAKVEKVLNTYDKCVKQGKYDSLKGTFDITKENGEWLYSEDRSYIIFKLKARDSLCMQLERQPVPKQSIHPKEEKCP